MSTEKAASVTHLETRSDSMGITIQHATSNLQEPEEAYSVSIVTMLAVFALALANCCATLSNTTNTTIRYQVMSVGGIPEASWIANGNFLLTLACAPAFGSLADRFGKKWIIVSACAIGVVGSFVSSSAHVVGTIIGGNILTGIAVSLGLRVEWKRSMGLTFHRTLVASYPSLRTRKSCQTSFDRELILPSYSFYPC